MPFSVAFLVPFSVSVGMGKVPMAGLSQGEDANTLDWVCVSGTECFGQSFFVNGSAFFDCEHHVSYDCKVRNCKSSEFGRIGGALAESSQIRTFRATGIQCLFCVKLVGLGT